MTIVVRSLALIVLILALAQPAYGQGPGRWWWEAGAGLDQITSETRTGDGPWSRNRSDGVRLNVGINGFVVHPLLVSFGLDLDVLHSRLNGPDDSDNSSLGGGATFNLFQTSPVPSGFSIHRILFDYSRSNESPLSSRGFPGVTTQWNGWMSVRSGPLRGGLFSFDHADTEAVDERLGRDVDERQRFDLTRRTHSAGHAVTLQRRTAEFGASEFTSEELMLRFVENGNIGEVWQWRATGSGIRRELSDEAGTDTVEDYDMATGFTGQLSLNQRLDLDLDLDGARFENDGRQSGQRLGVAYRRLLNRGWELGPFANYARRTFNEGESSAPGVGMTVVWKRQAGSRLDVLLRADGSVRRLRFEDDDGSRSDEQSAYGLMAVLAAGNPWGLRKELQLRADFDDLRQRNAIFDLPDFGLTGRRLTSQDVYSAELTLDHAWDSSNLSSRTEWVRTKDSRPELSRVESERFLSGVQLALRRLNLGANAGGGETTQADQNGQRFRFVGGNVSWRPTRLLRVRGQYRFDERDVNLAPDVDLVEYRLGVEVPLGQIRIEGHFEQLRQSTEDGPVRTTRAFRWSVSSSFSGWLPWETGTRRRGVIR